MRGPRWDLPLGSATCQQPGPRSWAGLLVPRTGTAWPSWGLASPLRGTEATSTLRFQIVKFLPGNSTAPRVDCAFLVSDRPWLPGLG